MDQRFTMRFYDGPAPYFGGPLSAANRPLVELELEREANGDFRSTEAMADYTGTFAFARITKLNGAFVHDFRHEEIQLVLEHFGYRQPTRAISTAMMFEPMTVRLPA